MGHLIDEKRFINNNIFKYEERMNSQYSRFLDKTPTFITYYNINNITSITDTGFLNVERIIDYNSPIRFKRIDDLPIYGLDTILLDLTDDEIGLDTSYDGEVVILPNTIRPLPNDCFTITYLDSNYLFMVTTVNYDTIKSNNYYKISFVIRSLTPDIKNQLLLQVEEVYNCVLTNIGTQEKCIIRSDIYEKIILMNEMYKEICEKYKILFYNIRYNSFMYIDEISHIKYYDKYLTFFINKHQLFNERYEYDTLFLVNEDDNHKFPLEYDKSFYHILEKNKKSMIPEHINYATGSVANTSSIFRYYNDVYVKSIYFSDIGLPYIDDILINSIINSIPSDKVSYKTIIDYFNNNVNVIDTFDMGPLAENDYIEYDLNSFILIPMLLFILRVYYNKFMAN